VVAGWEKYMKTYGIGPHRISVYERRDPRPSDAVRAVATASTICFVDRVFDGAGGVDTDAMTEALVRHGRLKIGMADPFEFRAVESFAEAVGRLPGRLKSWASAQGSSLVRCLRQSGC
jgi:hypothetical protein